MGGSASRTSTTVTQAAPPPRAAAATASHGGTAPAASARPASPVAGGGSASATSGAGGAAPGALPGQVPSSPSASTASAASLQSLGAGSAGSDAGAEFLAIASDLAGVAFDALLDASEALGPLGIPARLLLRIRKGCVQAAHNDTGCAFVARYCVGLQDGLRLVRQQAVAAPAKTQSMVDNQLALLTGLMTSLAELVERYGGKNAFSKRASAVKFNDKYTELLRQISAVMDLLGVTLAADGTVTMTKKLDAALGDIHEVLARQDELRDMLADVLSRVGDSSKAAASWPVEAASEYTLCPVAPPEPGCDFDAGERRDDLDLLVQTLVQPGDAVVGTASRGGSRSGAGGRFGSGSGYGAGAGARAGAGDEAGPPPPPQWSRASSSSASAGVPAPIVGVVGVSGVGKSELAKAAATDVRVRSHFSDGVIYIKVGDTDASAVAQRQGEVLADVLRQREPVPVATPQYGATRIRGELASRKCLIVLDDVWDVSGDVVSLVVTLGHAHEAPWWAGGSRVLITTQFKAVIVGATSRSCAPGAHPTKVEVSRLGLPDAKRVFSKAWIDGWPRVAEDPSEPAPPLPDDATLTRIVEVCGRLPLMLQQFGTQAVGDSDAVGRVVSDTESLVGSTASSGVASRSTASSDLLASSVADTFEEVAKLMAASASFLCRVNKRVASRGKPVRTRDVYEQFLRLVVVPDSAVVPPAVLALVWGARGSHDKAQAAAWMHALADFSLATVTSEGLMLHDLQRRFLARVDKARSAGDAVQTLGLPAELSAAPVALSTTRELLEGIRALCKEEAARRAVASDSQAGSATDTNAVGWHTLCAASAPASHAYIRARLFGWAAACSDFGLQREIAILALDPAWLLARIAADGASAAIGDVRLAQRMPCIHSHDAGVDGRVFEVLQLLLCALSEEADVFPSARNAATSGDSGGVPAEEALYGDFVAAETLWNKLRAHATSGSGDAGDEDDLLREAAAMLSDGRDVIVGDDGGKAGASSDSGATRLMSALVRSLNGTRRELSAKLGVPCSLEPQLGAAGKEYVTCRISAPDQRWISHACVAEVAARDGASSSTIVVTASGTNLSWWDVDRGGVRIHNRTASVPKAAPRRDGNHSIRHLSAFPARLPTHLLAVTAAAVGRHGTATVWHLESAEMVREVHAPGDVAVDTLTHGDPRTKFTAMSTLETREGRSIAICYVRPDGVPARDAQGDLYLCLLDISPSHDGAAKACCFGGAGTKELPFATYRTGGRHDESAVRAVCTVDGGRHIRLYDVDSVLAPPAEDGSPTLEQPRVLATLEHRAPPVQQLCVWTPDSTDPEPSGTATAALAVASTSSGVCVWSLADADSALLCSLSTAGDPLDWRWHGAEAVGTIALHGTAAGSGAGDPGVRHLAHDEETSGSAGGRHSVSGAATAANGTGAAASIAADRAAAFPMSRILEPGAPHLVGVTASQVLFRHMSADPAQPLARLYGVDLPTMTGTARATGADAGAGAGAGAASESDLQPVSTHWLGTEAADAAVISSEQLSFMTSTSGAAGLPRDVLVFGSVLQPMKHAVAALPLRTGLVVGRASEVLAKACYPLMGTAKSRSITDLSGCVLAPAPTQAVPGAMMLLSRVGSDSLNVMRISQWPPPTTDRRRDDEGESKPAAVRIVSRPGMLLALTATPSLHGREDVCVELYAVGSATDGDRGRRVDSCTLIFGDTSICAVEIVSSDDNEGPSTGPATFAVVAHQQCLIGFVQLWFDGDGGHLGRATDAVSVRRGMSRIAAAGVAVVKGVGVADPGCAVVVVEPLGRQGSESEGGGDARTSGAAPAAAAASGGTAPRGDAPVIVVCAIPRVSGDNDASRTADPESALARVGQRDVAIDLARLTDLRRTRTIEPLDDAARPRRQLPVMTDPSVAATWCCGSLVVRLDAKLSGKWHTWAWLDAAADSHSPPGPPLGAGGASDGTWVLLSGPRTYRLSTLPLPDQGTSDGRGKPLLWLLQRRLTQVLLTCTDFDPQDDASESEPFTLLDIRVKVHSPARQIEAALACRVASSARVEPGDGAPEASWDIYAVAQEIDSVPSLRHWRVRLPTRASDGDVVPTVTFTASRVLSASGVGAPPPVPWLDHHHTQLVRRAEDSIAAVGWVVTVNSAGSVVVIDVRHGDDGTSESPVAQRPPTVSTVHTFRSLHMPQDGFVSAGAAACLVGGGTLVVARVKALMDQGGTGRVHSWPANDGSGVLGCVDRFAVRVHPLPR